MSDRERVLRVAQPAPIGLIDGTVSTLAPLAAAFVAGSRAALLVGIAAALGAAISMGHLGGPLGRRRAAHAASLIDDVDTALAVAYPIVAAELVLIAWIRRRYMHVSLASSLVQVTFGGAIVAGLGIAVGHA